jgi:hypothetical protein
MRSAAGKALRISERAAQRSGLAPNRGLFHQGGQIVKKKETRFDKFAKPGSVPPGISKIC